MYTIAGALVKQTKTCPKTCPLRAKTSPKLPHASQREKENPSVSQRLTEGRDSTARIEGREVFRPAASAATLAWAGRPHIARWESPGAIQSGPSPGAPKLTTPSQRRDRFLTGPHAEDPSPCANRLRYAPVTVMGAILSKLGPVLAGIWLLFDRADKIASSELKSHVSRWLRTADPAAAVAGWLPTFVLIFDQVFGQRHFSWRCFGRSCVASLGAVTIVTLYWVASRPGQALSAIEA